MHSISDTGYGNKALWTDHILQMTKFWTNQMTSSQIICRQFSRYICSQDWLIQDLNWNRKFYILTRTLNSDDLKGYQ